MQWWLLTAAFDYVAFQRRKYLCVRQFTLKSLSFPEVFVPIQEVINSWSSWSTLRTLVWLRSALIRLYLHCSERWQPVAWGFVFCFHGRSQVCVYGSSRQKPLPSSSALHCVNLSLNCDTTHLQCKQWGIRPSAVEFKSAFYIFDSLCT